MFDLKLLILQMVTGVALGSVFVLLSIGLSLIFGMLTVVNFAHGAYFMVGAYVGVYALGVTGNFWLSLVIVPLAVGALGLLTERFLVRPLEEFRHEPACFPVVVDDQNPGHSRISVTPRGGRW